MISNVAKSSVTNVGPVSKGTMTFHPLTYIVYSLPPTSMPKEK